MGHKINPNSYRLGVQKPWQARWFFRGNYKVLLEQDEAIRNAIKNKIGAAGVVAVDIERTSNRSRINIKAAKPGLIIGRGGKGIEDLKLTIIRSLKKLQKKYPELKLPELSLNIEELKRSEVSASYIAQQIAWDMEKRLPFRRLIKKQLDQIMQNKEVKGAKIKVSGRLDGAEIARREWLSGGSLPLQTLRADIDYAEATAFTTYGTVGIKVWIYKGEIFESKGKNQNAKAKISI